jgi:GT2 family glycosyltransferase
LKPKVGIVVPTLGTRPEYLLQTLESIKAAGPCHVAIVAPGKFDPSLYKQKGLVDQVVVDPGTGLAAAINLGMSSLPQDVEYVNWLGDDDLLAEESLIATSKELDRDPAVGFVFGGCDYINPQGEFIWTNSSGSWAKALIRFGPDLIPQPGALVRRSLFEQIGGLDTGYKLAFDLDMFIRILKVSKGTFLNSTLASFRWHPESLSVSQRAKAIEEASQIRVRHLPPLIRPLSVLWEQPVKWATMRAGRRVSALAKRRAKA